MPNVISKKKKNVSPFRKIAIGTWSTAYDPTVYGILEVRMDEAARYMDEYRALTGKRLTYTHLLAKALSLAMAGTPEANAMLRWNRIYLRENVDVFMQVVMTDEETGEIDLSGVKILAMDKKSLAEIIDEVEKKAELVRKRKDPELESTRKNMSLMPFMFMNLILKFLSFLLYTLNLNLKWAGLPRDPFGSVMITSIGSLGLDQAYVPLVPYSRVPMLVATGKVAETPIVENGRVIVAKMIKLNATFDHRIIDGAHAAQMCRTMREVLEHPFEKLEPLPARATAKA